MPYAVLEQKIKSLSQEYYVQVENFVQFMLYEASRKKSQDSGKSVSEKLAEAPAIVSQAGLFSALGGVGAASAVAEAMERTAEGRKTRPL